MTEEKKSKIRKRIVTVLLCGIGVFIAYLIYGIATKNLNTVIFNWLIIGLLTMDIVLRDIVEPYLTKEFEQISAYRKDAYKRFLFWDVVSMISIVALVMTIAGESFPLIAIVGLMLFSVGMKKKRTYQDVFLGKVTEEGVEAAKLSAESKEE